MALNGAALNRAGTVVEKDRARAAELLKTWLHVLVMKSKDLKEFVSFGIAFDGFDIELYVTAFDLENNRPYQFYEIKHLKLSLPHNYTPTLKKLSSFMAKCLIYIGLDVHIVLTRRH